MTLGSEVNEQMLQPDGQSGTKPLVFTSQENLVLIYLPTEGMKGLVVLAHPVVWTSYLCMDNLDDQPFPPTNVGHVDEEMVHPGRRASQSNC
ncbi:hypothetical protein TNCV_1021511 [Trichonephila clavipes]|uniref:Uncharacterized protein n=1 Tax=Trichonephila clavipes TaxID=2585209 RepID=A0A8X6SLJ4_TRICX|nr:hypothetical protein TNCV_1021511 [Trichonephila clavipes]